MQIAELAAKLESLGLSDKEARVYVANLFLGPAAVQRIAEQASINRATTYVILDRLAELGLVSQSSEGKKTVFIAEGPEALDRLFDAEVELIEGRRKELKGLLPELSEMERATDSEAPVVRFYQGPDGIRSALGYLSRKASPKTEIYAMSNEDEVRRIAPYIQDEAPKARLKKKMPSKVIYSTEKGFDLKTDSRSMRETSKIPDRVAADLTLYKDKAAIFTYKGEKPVGVVIESEEIVTVLRQLFSYAWKATRK